MNGLKGGKTSVKKKKQEKNNQWNFGKNMMSRQNCNALILPNIFDSDFFFFFFYTEKFGQRSLNLGPKLGWAMLLCNQ